MPVRFARSAKLLRWYWCVCMQQHFLVRGHYSPLTQSYNRMPSAVLQDNDTCTYPQSQQFCRKLCLLLPLHLARQLRLREPRKAGEVGLERRWRHVGAHLQQQQQQTGSCGCNRRAVERGAMYASEEGTTPSVGVG